MYVIGISSYFHDSAVAVFKNGELVFYSMEDRFSRLKHDSRFPSGVINYVLENVILDRSKIEKVFFYENTEKKLIRILREVLQKYPFSFRSFYNVASNWFFEKFWIKAKIASAFKIPFSKIELGDHHLSHSFYGFVPSGYREALVFCSDGMGDTSSLTISKFNKDKNISYEILREYSIDNSLGLVYSAFTSFMGFKVNDGECSLMAISRFGEPKYNEEIRKVFRIDKEEEIYVDQSHFDFSVDAEKLYTKKFIETFGKPFDGKFSASATCSKTELLEKEVYYLDLAASFHSVFEDVFAEIVKKYIKHTGIKNIVITGGVAQNCVLIEKLERLDVVKDVYVPLDPGDGGGAIGCCLEFLSGHGLDVSSVDSVYMGRSMEGVEKVLKIKEIQYKTEKFLIESTKLERRSDLVDQVLDDILEDKVIALFNGPLEIGPRALGNRSIIFSPTSKIAHDKVSNKIKKRAPYRPYALSMLEEDFSNYFIVNHVTRLHERMQTTVKMKKENEDLAQFGLHVDGTTRPQIVREKNNEFFYNLLQRKKEREGTSIVVNTSFNPSSFPIVDSPVDALHFLIKTELDALVMGEYIFRKTKV